MIKVDIKGDVLELDDLDLSGVADALADNLKRAVRSQPGGRWNKTGELLRGIRATDDAVTIPSDHLTRDPELAQKFADDVMPDSPLAERNVREAGERAVRDAISDGDR